MCSKSACFIFVLTSTYKFDMTKHDLLNIIQIGEALFKTQGYHHTGTDEILKKANFPRSSFYYHFKNKEGFAIRVLENYGNASAEFYKEFLLNPSINSPLERFQTFLDTMGKFSEESNFESICLIQKMSNECAGTNENIRKNTQIELEKLLDVFRACIQEGQIKGEFRSDIDATTLAKFLHAQLYGANLLARLAKSKTPMEENLKMALDYISA